MWFDAHAKLAEIAGHPPATSATTATQAPPVSQLSRVSQAPEVENHSFVAKVASVATPSAPRTFRHGVSVSGQPKTWTGRIVSLDDWRHLTAWEKHGPNGRHWNGITKQWEKPERGTT